MYTVTEGAHPRLRSAVSVGQEQAPEPIQPVPALALLSAGQVAAWLLRGWVWLVLAALIGVVASVAFDQLATPRFTATTDLVIAPSNLRVVSNDLYAQNLQSDSQILEVESRMRVIASSSVLSRVVARLGLEHTPEFAVKQPFFDVRALLGFKPARQLGGAEQAVVSALAERVKVSRQERSYVVTISVWASEADLSARIANAIAEAFQEEIAQADAERAGRAAQSLSDRLGTLRTAVAEAEAKVEAFRSRHGLQQGATGQLVNAQAMERMGGKVTDARTRLAEAEAHYREITRALNEAGARAGAVQSQALTSLLGEEAALRRQVASLSQTYGPRHPSRINAQAELDAITRAIQTEIQRQRRAAQLEVGQARQALETLQGETLQLRGTVSEDDRAQVRLRELEREAKTRAALYQSVLTRAGEAAERQQIDATDVRVISPATPPIRPTWPPRLPIAATAGGALGLGLGAALVVGFSWFGARRRNRTDAA